MVDDSHCHVYKRRGKRLSALTISHEVCFNEDKSTPCLSRYPDEPFQHKSNEAYVKVANMNHSSDLRNGQVLIDSKTRSRISLRNTVLQRKLDVEAKRETNGGAFQIIENRKASKIMHCDTLNDKIMYSPQAYHDYKRNQSEPLTPSCIVKDDFSEFLSDIKSEKLTRSPIPISCNRPLSSKVRFFSPESRKFFHKYFDSTRPANESSKKKLNPKYILFTPSDTLAPSTPVILTRKPSPLVKVKGKPSNISYKHSNDFEEDTMFPFPPPPLIFAHSEVPEEEHSREVTECGKKLQTYTPTILQSRLTASNETSTTMKKSRSLSTATAQNIPQTKDPYVFSKETEKAEVQVNTKRGSFKRKRKSNGNRKRDSHNTLERMRRTQQFEKFQRLREELPSLRDNPKAAKIKILKEAISCIQHLQNEHQNFEKTRTTEKRKNEELLTKLCQLSGRV